MYWTGSGTSVGKSNGSWTHSYKFRYANEVPAKESRQIGQRPVEFGLELQLLDQKRRNQCRLNPDVESISDGTNKCLDLEALLESFVEQLIPTILNRTMCQGMSSKPYNWGF